MQSEQPLKPANVLNIVATNQGRRPLTMATPHAAPLTPEEVVEQMAAGAVVVDARSSAEFGAGHIKGAFNVQLASGEFEQRVGWVTPDDVPIILVTGNSAEAQTAIHKMAFVALDAQVQGFLDGGIVAWMKAGMKLETIPQIDVHTLHHRLSTNGLRVIDSREQDEWDEGHIAQAHLVPYVRMAPQITSPSRLPTLDIPLDASVAVTCATGKRSSTAISLMLRHGYTKLYNVTGGMEAWKDAKLPTVDGDGVVCPI